jgi:hypothetical protein
MSELSDAQCDRILVAVSECAHQHVRRHDYPQNLWLWCDDCSSSVRRANWPPPARGTHSSDYPSGRRCPCADATTQTARYGPVPDQTYEAHLAEYEAAARWSRGL